jgi:hypothetical protein
MLDFIFWCIEEKKMYESHEIGFIDLFGGRVQINNEWKFFDKERYGGKVNCIPLQFTNKKDKNGIKIYDGAILRSSKGTLWIVSRCKDGLWVISTSRNTTSEYFSLEDSNPIWTEMIGNRYENKQIGGPGNERRYQ